jgi:radical SAM protein with 4Fe4S-binding SPASM domain
MKYHKPPYLLQECKIEVTYRCPLACIHCSSDATPDNAKEMEVNKCLTIIKEAAALGCKKMSFSGGEPLLWGGIDEAVRTAADLALNVTIYSSGNVDEHEKRLQALKDSGASKIIFSIFGGSVAAHERITRTRGSFDKTLKAVKSAVRTGLTTEFHFVPLAINYRELKDIVKLAKELEARAVSVLRFVPQGRGYLIRKHVLDRLQNLELKKMIEAERGNGFNIRTGSPFNFLLLNDQPECSSAIDRVIIGPDFKIYPCDAFKQIRSEEIVKTDKYSDVGRWTLAECWGDSPFLNAVRGYLTTDFHEPCNGCSAIEKCLSGCLAQKVLKTADFRKQPDPMCIMNKTEE